MSDQDNHIKVLKELSTLSPGEEMMGSGRYLVKTSANDIINAGRRLEEIGLYNFNKSDDSEHLQKIINLRDSIIDKHYRHFTKSENILISEGGSRSGKTNNMIRFAILANQISRFNLNIIAPSYKMLNLGSFLDAKDFIEENEIDVKMPAAATQIKFKSGGTITFEVVTSETEAKRNRDNVFINEADGIKEAVADLIIGRAKARTFIDYNPTRKFWSEKYKTDTNCQKTSFLDNPFLSQSQKEWFERLRKAGEKAEKGSPERYAYEVYFLGNYSSLAKSVFRGSDFKFWDDLPLSFDHVFSYADPSLGVGADYFAAGLFGVNNTNVYLIDSVFSQYETAETFVKKMKAWDNLFSNCEHFIETNGIGKLIYNKIANGYTGLLHSVSNADNKNGDIILYSPEAKQVLYNKSQTTDEIIKQCVAFPDAEHDDAPDMICRAQKIIQKYFVN
jgi:hypothetical protein